MIYMLGEKRGVARVILARWLLVHGGFGVEKTFGRMRQWNKTISLAEHAEFEEKGQNKKTFASWHEQ